MTRELLQAESHDQLVRPEHYQEVERQFTTIAPGVFEPFKENCEIEEITHIYLSRQDEEFSLRVSEITSGGETAYRATLKDRGELTTTGLRRLEIETEISEDAFRFYDNRGTYAKLQKRRVSPTKGVTIDWCIPEGQAVIELEYGDGNDDTADFLESFAPYLRERTGEPEVSSEALAYRSSPECRDKQGESVTAETIIATILAARAAGAGRLIVGIAGRSGSGKSTLARNVIEEIEKRGGSLTVESLSSDDYNRGRRWLESYNNGQPWKDWDASIVYDTASMSHDLQLLRSGLRVPRRSFDFPSQEPAIAGVVEPADVILCEGICINSADLDDSRDFLFTLTTPAATSIGRRLQRDIRDGRLHESLDSLESIFRYQVEYVEPAHLRRCGGR